MSYPSDRLHEEVAFIAYYFHWEYDRIMRLEHRERRRWVAEIGRIHERLAGPESAMARGSTRAE